MNGDGILERFLRDLFSNLASGMAAIVALIALVMSARTRRDSKIGGAALLEARMNEVEDSVKDMRPLVNSLLTDAAVATTRARALEEKLDEASRRIQEANIKIDEVMRFLLEWRHNGGHA